MCPIREFLIVTVRPQSPGAGCRLSRLLSSPMTNQAPELDSAVPQSTVTSTGELQPTLFQRDGSPQPPRRTRTLWQSARRATFAVFSACAAVVTVLDSPLAWAAWACTFYFVALYLGFTVFVTATERGRPRLSELSLAGLLVGSIVCAVVGSFFSAHGLSGGPAGHDVKSVVASVKRTIVAEVNKSIKEVLTAPTTLALVQPLSGQSTIVRAKSECGGGVGGASSATAEAESVPPPQERVNPKAGIAKVKATTQPAPKEDGSGPGGTMAPSAPPPSEQTNPAEAQQTPTTPTLAPSTEGATGGSAGSTSEPPVESNEVTSRPPDEGAAPAPTGESTQGEPTPAPAEQPNTPTSSGRH
jgi:hypothetical protein